MLTIISLKTKEVTKMHLKLIFYTDVLISMIITFIHAMTSLLSLLMINSAIHWHAMDQLIYAMATVLDIPIVIGCVTPQGGINWTIRKPITSGRVERFQQDRYNGSNALYIGWTGSGEGKYFLPPRGSDPNHYRALTRLPVAHASQFPPTSQVPQDARPRSPIPGLDPACLESSPKPSRKPSSPVVKVRGRKSNRVFIDQ